MEIFVDEYRCALYIAFRTKEVLMLIFSLLLACTPAPKPDSTDTVSADTALTVLEADFASGDELWLYTDSAADFEFFMLSCASNQDFPCGEGVTHVSAYQDTYPWLVDFVDGLVYAADAGALCTPMSETTAKCPALFENPLGLSPQVGLRVVFTHPVM